MSEPKKIKPTVLMPTIRKLAAEEQPVPKTTISDAFIPKFVTTDPRFSTDKISSKGIVLDESKTELDPIYTKIPREHIMSWAHDIPQIVYNHAYTLLPALEHLKVLADFQAGETLTNEHINAICALISMPDDKLAERFFAPQLDDAYGEDIYQSMQYSDGAAPYMDKVMENMINRDGKEFSEPVPSASLLFAYNAMGDYLSHFLPMSGIFKHGASVETEQKIDSGVARTLCIYAPEDYVGFDSMQPSFGEGYDMFYKVLTRANNLFQHPEAGSRKNGELNADNIHEKLESMGVEGPDDALEKFATFFADAARNMGIEPNTEHKQLIDILDDQLRSQIYNAVNLTVHMLEDAPLGSPESMRITISELHFCKWWADQRKAARDVIGDDFFSFDAEDALEQLIHKNYEKWVDNRLCKYTDEPGIVPLVGEMRTFSIQLFQDAYRPIITSGWKDGCPHTTITANENSVVPYNISSSSNFSPRFPGSPHMHNRYEKGYVPTVEDERPGEYYKEYHAYTDPGHYSAAVSKMNECAVAGYGPSGGLGFLFTTADERPVHNEQIYEKMQTFMQCVGNKGILGLFKNYFPHPLVEEKYVNKKAEGHKKRHESYRDSASERIIIERNEFLERGDRALAIKRSEDQKYAKL